MLKKSTYLIAFILIFVIATSAVLSSFRPPEGYTGANPAMTCNNAGCHADFPLNVAGGGVTAPGLPSAYIPDQAYPFSVTINHATADRTRWGFSIIALDAGGTPIGTFSSTNPNASPNGNELSHGNAIGPTFAPITGAQASYTFDNLTWTAPPGGSGPVTFYFTGVAANANGAVTGDYVYRDSIVAGVLPISLYSFNAIVKNNNVLLSWQTAQEINSNYFTIQRSYDNRQFTDIGKINASGSSSVAKNYSFTDDNPSYFEKPIYYRLSMVDKDGAKTYSKIENIVLKATATFIKNVYPNPLKPGNTLHLNLVSKNNEVLLLKLIDNGGRLIKSMELPAQKGSNILDVSIPVCSAGNYKLFIKGSEGIIQAPLMIH